MTDSHQSRVPIDAVALLLIAFAIVVTHLPMIGSGMCLNDPTWYFHFGNRVNHGDVPYRDFVFQVGPLPIYVDAAFQNVFGSTYVASLYAGLCVKILRVWIVWLAVRRVASWRAASFLAVFCAFDPVFAYVHHWSTPWADALVGLCGVALLVASRSPTRLWPLVIAGLLAGLVVSARQSTAVLVILFLLGACGVLSRRDSLTPRRLGALALGIAGGLAIVCCCLALVGALGPAIQQMFIDAPSKKAFGGLGAVLDAVSGGAIVDGRYNYLTGFLVFLGLPTAVAVAIVVGAARERRISSVTLAIVGVPMAVGISALARDVSFELLTDLPRMFLTTITALAILFPDRLRSWFGIEPLVALAFAGLSLVSDWALEMSAPGRGWTHISALMTGAILVTLASTHLSIRIKEVFCGALAIAGLTHVVLFTEADLNPFLQVQMSDTQISTNTARPKMRGTSHPMLAGVTMPVWRARALEWLATHVAPGETCFVYANLPSLYDLLGCTNPTRVDTTIADFPSAADAREVAATLAAHPPDVIIAHEQMWMSPPISQDLGDSPAAYDSWNPHASFAIHRGLRAIIDRYQSVGTVAEALGPELAAMAANRRDSIDAVRVYRRIR